MTFDAFLEQAWTDHGDHPQDVAERLRGSRSVIERAEQVPPLARLATHVFGEHLGQWNDGVEFLESLRSLPALDSGSATAAAVTRGIATLRYAGGDHGVVDALSSEDRVAVLAAASSALAGRHAIAPALDAFADAVRIADQGLPAGSPAHRALAVGGNNLAATLEEKRDRDAGETKGMVAAAAAALKYWKLAGTWLEEERAEHRLACSLLEAGDSTRATQSARRCIEICEHNQAPAFERFFAYAALARALRSVGDAAAFEASRASALQWLACVLPDAQQWCEAERRALGAA